jgi:hypothetical protein
MTTETQAPEQEQEQAPSAAVEPAAVLEEVRGLVQELQSLHAALERAAVAEAEAEKALDESRRALADHEAEAFRQDRPLDDDAPAVVAYEAAQLAVDRCRAGAAGLRRRIAAADAEVLVAVVTLAAAREAFNRASIGEFLQREQTIITAYHGLLRRARALADALGVNMSDASLAALLHPPAADWREDEAAEALHAELSGPRELAAALGRLADNARIRQIEAERERSVRPPFDPSGRYVVLRSCLSHGRRFEPGAVVDARLLHAQTLYDLYITKHLKLIEQADEWQR